jgi:hypothetical protein
VARAARRVLSEQQALKERRGRREGAGEREEERGREGEGDRKERQEPRGLEAGRFRDGSIHKATTSTVWSRAVFRCVEYTIMTTTSYLSHSLMCAVHVQGYNLS